jgi:hypothetical protein
VNPTPGSIVLLNLLGIFFLRPEGLLRGEVRAQIDAVPISFGSIAPASRSNPRKALFHTVQIVYDINTAIIPQTTFLSFRTGAEMVGVARTMRATVLAFGKRANIGPWWSSGNCGGGGSY